MVAIFGSLSVVPWILFAQSSWNMDAVPVITAVSPSPEGMAEVWDRAEVFGRGAEQRAREALRRIHREHRIPVRIETIRSLDGAWIADVARRRSQTVATDQLYILVAGSEREVGVIAARLGPARRLTDRERESIRRAFLGPLQAGEADGALEQGVRAIGATLDPVARPGLNLNSRDNIIAVTLAMAIVAVLLASQTWERYGARSRRRRRAAVTDHAQFDDLLGQQPQRPPLLSVRRRRAVQIDEAGFLRPVEGAGVKPLRALGDVGRFGPLLDDPPADALGGPGVGVQRRGDFLVGPSRCPGSLVRVEQDMGVGELASDVPARTVSENVTRTGGHAGIEAAP